MYQVKQNWTLKIEVDADGHDTKVFKIKRDSKELLTPHTTKTYDINESGIMLEQVWDVINVFGIVFGAARALAFLYNCNLL